MHCQVSDWYGFERLDLTFEGRKAILIRPGAGDGRWMLKTEYFPAFQDLERALVEKGTVRTGRPDSADHGGLFRHHSPGHAGDTGHPAGAGGDVSPHRYAVLHRL